MLPDLLTCPYVQRFKVILKVKRKKAKEIDLGGGLLIKKKTDLFYTRNDGDGQNTDPQSMDYPNGLP